MRLGRYLWPAAGPIRQRAAGAGADRAALDTRRKPARYAGGGSRPAGAGPPGAERLLLSGRADVGNVCGFDMLASLFSRLRELPAEMWQMLQSVLFGLPFTLLCQTSPSACNTYKQMQHIANFDLRAIHLDVARNLNN